ELLEGRAGLEVVHAGDALPALMTWMRGQDRSNWPHLLVVELLPNNADDQARAAVAALRKAGMRVLLLSCLFPRWSAQRIAADGVDGIASKLDGEHAVLECVAAALAGEAIVTARAKADLASDTNAPELSTQERRVLELYAVGNPIAVVAERI